MSGALFAPTVLDWLFGAGIGTNLGAAIVWVPIGALLGYLWSRSRYWPLHALHVRLERHEALHAEHAEKLDQLLRALAGEDDGVTASTGGERRP